MNSKSWGVIFLALFLLLFGIGAITNIRVIAMSVIEGILAILASVCLILGK